MSDTPITTHILARIEQNLQWYQATLHPGTRIGTPDPRVSSLIEHGICTPYPQVDILEVCMPDDPDGVPEFYYLVRDATQEELERGLYIITLLVEEIYEKHTKNYVRKKIFLVHSDGYAHTNILEYAQEELQRMVEHPEQYPELIPPPFQIIGTLY